MEESRTDMQNCTCDPFKIIIRWFFEEIYDSSGVSSEFNAVHLFYKSPLFYLPVHDCLQVKILHETLKAVKFHVEDNYSAENSKRQITLPKYSPQNLEDIVKSISIKSHTLVKAVSLDKLKNISLQLNSSVLKESVIKWTLNVGSSWFKSNSCHNDLYKVDIAMTNVAATEGSHLFLNFRKTLIAQTILTVCKKLGYLVDEENFLCLPDGTLSNAAILVAGKVIPSKFEIDSASSNAPQILESGNQDDVKVVLQLKIGGIGAKKTSQCSTSITSLNELMNLRLQEIKEISESRKCNSEPHSSWVTSIHNLAKATLNYDLLIKSVDADAILLPLSASCMNHDALFIMYNYARILSILRRFEDLVNNSEYPCLPDLAEADFSGIGEKNEEIEILQLLLEWPRILELAVNFVRYECNLVIISKFLLALAKAFNKFYFEVVVLVPVTAPHNFPEMMARVHFLKAINLVFDDCLEIMQIRNIHK